MPAESLILIGIEEDSRNNKLSVALSLMTK